MKPKKLKWRRAGNCWEADALGFRWSIWGDGSEWGLILNGYQELGEFKTLREAEAAAQAQFK